MAKKSGFFSWFNKDKSNSDKTDPEAVVETKVEQEEVVTENESSEQTKPDATPQAEVDQAETEVALDSVQESDLDEIKSDEVEVRDVTNLEPEILPDHDAEPIAELNAEEESISETQLELESAPIIELEPESAVEPKLQPEPMAEPEPTSEPEPTVEPEPQTKLGFFERLKQGLTKTRQQLGGGFLSLFKGKKIDDELYEELETQLLMADVGMDTTVKLIDSLTDHADRKQLKDAEALYELLKQEMSDILAKADQPLVIENPDGPFVILMVGVNGVGKTTTIGKMAKQFQLQGKSVMLAAGDTFRAAAVEQLQVWGERNNVPVVAQHTGADSASVIFDAYQAAKARNVDVLIADTAGRLQNKENLMQELEKIVRVLKKMDASVPHEVMLTIDATTGQNAMSQTKLFNEAVNLTGISLTKLDGSAKGGVIFSVANQFDIPIRYIGMGEGVDDLRTFEHKSFINALFD